VIVARTQKKLTEVYLDLEEEMSKMGMEINENKTKYMVTSTYEHRRNAEDLRIGNKTFKAVHSFQYLGNIIGNTNSNNKCIKERNMMGNKAYYANRKLVNSILISRNSKLQIYCTLVGPVVTYGSESWTLTMEEERALAVFEWKILLKIYGPVKENKSWRILRNDESEAIIKGENIVRFIKRQRIRWLVHIERMQDTAIPKKMYGKLYATRRKKKKKMRWLNDVFADLRKMGKNEWRGRARDREAWRRIVKGGQGLPRAVVPLKKKYLTL
jgi:hypothetical protein